MGSLQTAVRLAALAAEAEEVRLGRLLTAEELVPIYAEQFRLVDEAVHGERPARPRSRWLDWLILVVVAAFWALLAVCLTGAAKTLFTGD